MKPCQRIGANSASRLLFNLASAFSISLLATPAFAQTFYSKCSAILKTFGEQHSSVTHAEFSTKGASSLAQAASSPPPINYLRVPKSKAPPEFPFGDFYIKDQLVSYESLPATAKRVGPDYQHLFYAKEAKKNQTTEDVIKHMFSKGISRPKGHNDVDAHHMAGENSKTLGLTKSAQNSDFSNYTTDLEISYDFGNISFVTDTRGLELLNINQAYARLNKIPQFYSEKEILSRKHRNPERIIGAVVNTKGKKIFYLNPNYKGDDAKPLATARRFLDPEHWDDATQKYLSSNEADPISIVRDYYGPQSMKSFERAAKQVEELAPKRLPTVDDLAKLNAISLENVDTSYGAYHINRQQKISSKNARYAELKKDEDFTTLEKEFGTANPKPGVYRQFGTLGFSSPHMNEGKSSAAKTFSREQVESIMDNSHITLKKSTPQPDGSVKADFEYPSGENVSELVNSAFNEMTRASQDLKEKSRVLSHEAYEEKALEVAAKFYKELVSIHPFWDGNGRSAKLARDWMLENLGIDPPAFTPANEFELSHSQIVTSLKEGIEQTRLLAK